MTEHEKWLERHQERLEMEDHYRANRVIIVEAGADFMLQATMKDKGGWCDLLLLNYDLLRQLAASSRSALEVCDEEALKNCSSVLEGAR